MHASVLLSVLAAAPLLGSDDPAQRLTAVAQWARTQKTPQLTAKQARAASGCVELPAVKDTGCERPTRLCPIQEGDDGSSGTRVEQLSFVLDGHEDVHKPLRLWWRAAYEPRRHECDPPELMIGEETPTQRAQRVAAWRSTHQREWAACVARVEKDSADDAEELTCDVVLANACRKEAYVVCHAKNLRKGLAQLEKLHRLEL